MLVTWRLLAVPSILALLLQGRSQIPAPVRITVRVWEPVGSVQVSR